MYAEVIKHFAYAQSKVVRKTLNNFNVEDWNHYSNMSFMVNNVAFHSLPKDGRKILLINKRNKEIQIQLQADAKDSCVSCVEITNENPPSQGQLNDNTIRLKSISVAVIKLKN